MCFWTAWSSHQTLQSSVRGLANLQSSSEVRILRCSLPSPLPTLLPLLFFFSSIPFFISSFLLPSTFSLLLSSSLSYSLLSCSSHSLLLYFFSFLSHFLTCAQHYEMRSGWLLSRLPSSLDILWLSLGSVLLLVDPVRCATREYPQLSASLYLVAVIPLPATILSSVHWLPYLFPGIHSGLH